jgi:tol-pal system protein YbgF
MAYMKRILFSLLLSFSLLCAASFAEAQSKRDLAAQNAQLNQRISLLEKRLLTGDPAAERLLARMDSLEAAQRGLTGEIERLRYERENLQAEVEALIGDIRAMQDLSTRMKIHLDAVDLVATTSPDRSAPKTYGDAGTIGNSGTYSNDGTFGSSPNSQPSPILGPPVYREKDLVINGVGNDFGSNPSDLPPVSNPQLFDPEADQVVRNNGAQMNDVSGLGELGVQRLYEGDFVGAQTALSQYLQFNPDAPDAGEMNFWLGESYYVRGGFADAADAYITSMRLDGKGVKAPEAMVRLAATLRQLGNVAEACQTLASFPRQYPNANETVKEKARIESARTQC